MKLVFRKSSHHLQSLADNDGQISSLKVFGQPLIVRNASVASKVLNIDKIMIPKDFPDSLRPAGKTRRGTSRPHSNPHAHWSETPDRHGLGCSNRNGNNRDAG